MPKLSYIEYLAAEVKTAIHEYKTRIELMRMGLLSAESVEAFRDEVVRSIMYYRWAKRSERLTCLNQNQRGNKRFFTSRKAAIDWAETKSRYNESYMVGYDDSTGFYFGEIFTSREIA